VIWVTQIVNQPFPSKVHALTGRVNRYDRELRVISDAGRVTQYKDVGVRGWSSSAFTLSAWFGRAVNAIWKAGSLRRRGEPK
jgi:hypothetical protein